MKRPVWKEARQRKQAEVVEEVKQPSKTRGKRSKVKEESE